MVKQSLIAVAMLAVAMALASCGFVPMYADGNGTATASWEQVDVAQPANRLEQLVYAELVRNRPPAQVGGRAFELQYSVEENKANLLGIRLERVRLKSRFSLVDRASGRVLMQGNTFADASMETTRLHFADAQAQDAVRRQAARQVAEDIRTRVAAFLARGMPASAAPVGQATGAR